MMTAAVRATYPTPRIASLSAAVLPKSYLGAPATTRDPLFARNVSTESSLAKVSKDGVVGHPIDFDINSKIEGNESQIVTITLEPGQVLRAESGAMMYMTQGVEMNTTTGYVRIHTHVYRRFAC